MAFDYWGISSPIMDLSACYFLQILRVATQEVKNSIHAVMFLPITCQMLLTTFEQECNAFKVMASVDIPVVPILRK